jgi:TonB family protein
MIAWLRNTFAVAAVLVAWCIPAGDAGAQLACARPNVPAQAIHAVTPDVPPMAQQQGIFGTVQVIVSLDPQSRVVGTRIQSSPSAILNAAALSAARQSTFQTEIRDCVPIAADFVYTVTFANQDGAAASNRPGLIAQQLVRTGDDSKPTVVITMQGTAARPPDVAYVSAGFITNDDVATAASAKNDAIFAALQAKVAALGIDASKIKQIYYNVSYAARPSPSPVTATPAPSQAGVQVYSAQAPRYGYVVSRQLQLTVDAVTKVGAVIDALVAAGATTVNNVQYTLADPSAAYNDALASALKAAKAQATTVALGSGMHLGGVKQIQVQQQYLTPQPFSMRGPAGIPAAVNVAAPATVDVRATVVVTYYLKP